MSRGLGRIQQLVLAALEDHGPATGRDIAKRVEEQLTGCPPEASPPDPRIEASVRRALSTLQKRGLAFLAVRGTWSTDAQEAHDGSWSFDDIYDAMASGRGFKSTAGGTDKRTSGQAKTAPSASPGGLPQQDRDRLKKLLGMLGSRYEGEREQAARKVHELLRRHGLSWDDLI